MKQTKVNKVKTRRIIPLKEDTLNKHMPNEHKYIFSTKKKSVKKILPSKAIISLEKVRILPENLRNNKKVVLKALDANIAYFNSISPSLKDDIDIGKKIMEKNPGYFKYLSEKLRDNKELAIKAVKFSPPLYNVLSERLKIDDSILKITDFVKVTSLYFKFKQKIDKPKYLKILKSLSRYKTFDPNLLIGVTDDVLNDKNIVIKTIKLSKKSYESIPNHLKNDDDVIETLIKHPTFNDDDLVNYFYDYNKNIALLTMKYHPELYKNLKSEFLIDKDVILSAFKSNTRQSSGYYIREISPLISTTMKEDKDIKDVLESKKNKYYFSDKYSDDKKFILKNVHRWNTIQFVSNRLKNDKDVVISALTNPARGKYEPDTILQHISPKLREDKDIFLKALENRIKVNKLEQLNKSKTEKKIKLKNKSKRNP